MDLLPLFFVEALKFIPSAPKHLHTMMLPPECFTVGVRMSVQVSGTFRSKGLHTLTCFKLQNLLANSKWFMTEVLQRRMLSFHTVCAQFDQVASSRRLGRCKLPVFTNDRSHCVLRHFPRDTLFFSAHPQVCASTQSCLWGSTKQFLHITACLLLCHASSAVRLCVDFVLSCAFPSHADQMNSPQVNFNQFLEALRRISENGRIF